MTQTFESLGASASVAKALKAKGFDAPFEIQTMVIPDALKGVDILAKSRTGSGKTLAFAIPIVESLKPQGSPSAVILVPTRELATQVAEDFAGISHARNLKVTAVYGGVGLVEQAKRAKRSDIIVATPGRLEDLADRRMIKLDRVAILVLDEADRMLDMGFQPQVDRIVRRIPKDRQTMFFSATLDGVVGRLANAYTRDPKTHEVVSPMQTVDEVDHIFVKVDQNDKLSTLINVLQEAPGMALVFVRTKRGADRLSRKLKSHGMKADAIHGDLTQSQRERSLRRFEKGQVATLVATDVAARGIDVDGIARVINFDPPDDHKSYVHRVGRTARAGRTGTGITLVIPSQEGDVGRVASRLKLEGQFEKDGMKVPLPAMAFSSSRRGRRPGGARGGQRRRRR